MSRKGVSRKQKRGFQKGHEFSPRGEGTFKRDRLGESVEPENPLRKRWTRLNQDQFRSVGMSSSGIIQSKTLEGRVNQSQSYLRPIKKEPDFYEQYVEETGLKGRNNLYALLHFEKTAELFNTAFKEHHNFDGECKGDLTWDMEHSVKWGLCRKMALKCTKCSYKSTCTKLYHEVPSDKKGPKAAGPNVSVQVALNRQGIGASGLIDLVHGMQMEAPCFSSLGKAGHKVCQTITEENQRDMSNKGNYLKELNEQLGRKRDLITVEADGTYNNALYSGVGKTATQPATQATYLVSENVSAHKYVLHVGTYNKLCRACPDGQHGGANCTQTVAENSVIGNEGQYLTNAIESLNADGLYVTEITMDGDSNANKVAQELEQDGSDIQIDCQRCVRHLGQTVRRSLKNCTFSDDFFPGVTREQVRYVSDRFALDLMHRSQTEAKLICDAHNGDKDLIVASAKHMPITILNCYKGDCNNCDQYSFICSKDHVWSRPFISTIKLSVPDRSFITPTKADEAKLLEMLEKRFSYATMMKTYKNQTSNKCDGCNRALIKAVPKHITFSRNYTGRANAAIHSVNNSPGVSLLKLCSAAGAPLPACTELLGQLKQEDRRRNYIKTRQSLKEHRERLAAKRHSNFQRYDDMKAEKYYKKGLVDEEGGIPVASSSHEPEDPIPGRRRKQARMEYGKKLEADFGSMGWDHDYGHYPRRKGKKN